REHIFAVRRRGEDGERGVAPPAFVTELVSLRFRIVEAIDDVPILVARLRLVLAQIPEGKKVAPGVIENAVNNDPDAARMRFLDHLKEKLVRGRPLPGCGIGGFLFDQSQITARVGSEVWIDVV